MQIFVLERTVQFEFVLFFGYDKFIYLNFVSIHDAYGGKSAFVVVMAAVLKTDVASDKLIG